MKEKGMDELFSAAKELQRKSVPIYLSAKRNIQTPDRSGSADGTFYCQPEFK